MLPDMSFAVRPLRIAAFCGIVAAVVSARAQYPSSPQITKDGTAVSLAEYASLPLSSRTTGAYPPAINYAGQLGRVNFLRSEPTNAPLSASRFFVCDLNRNLYILDKTSKVFTAYINFEEVFPRFDNNPGYSGGLVTFAFDPDYATNGIFYTVHTELTNLPALGPTNGQLPGLTTNGYTVTTAVDPPAGPVARRAVLIEWTDTNINNAVFEGAARELLRAGFNDVIHPLGDLVFNPRAQPGDADYRNLYVVSGDGGAGESNDARHTVPQRLDTLLGKVLRITPDLALRTNTSTSSANGRYRIPTNGPDPNPFVTLGLPGLKKEIYAYGFRNPHRLSWDAASDALVVDDIGLGSWEEVNLIHKGGNYGYAEREGGEQLFVGGINDGKTGSQAGVPFPTNADFLTVTGLLSTVAPVYPVSTYSHRDGDAITSGFVYRGSLMPALRGKYIFGDITTGRIFYCDLAEMLAADDGNRLTTATIRELQIVFNGVKRRVFDILSDKYHQKNGNSGGSALPGGCGGLATGGNDPEGFPYGCGRADIRLAQGADGELYLLSKSDGMIRKFTAVLIPPTISNIRITNGVATLTWPAISNRTYRVQYKTSLTNAGWTDLSGDVTATSTNATKTDAFGTTARFYRVQAQ